MRDRTTINLEPTESKGTYSNFEITINPNVVYHDRDSPEAIAMSHRLKKLSNWVLTKKGIKQLLTYKSGNDEWDKVVEITDDDAYRFAAIEWGQRDHKIHAHLGIQIIHHTKLMINKDKLEAAVAKICGIPKTQVYIHLQARGRNWRDYVGKYKKET